MTSEIEQPAEPDARSESGEPPVTVEEVGEPAPHILENDGANGPVTPDAPSLSIAKATVGPPTKQADLRPSFFRRLSPLGRVVSALIAIVSFVTGIIAVVPILAADVTNFGSLRIAAQPFGSELEYAVPTTAPFDTFPGGSEGICTAVQQDWLELNGQRITTRYLVDLRNVASEGAMLALKNFRGTGTTSADEPLVKVVCDPTGSGTAPVQAARLFVSDPAEVAYFDKSAFGQTGEGIPDSPVVWNLAPGETGQLVVALFPSATFTGRLDLTAISGSEQRDYPIAVGETDSISFPGLVRGGMTFLEVDGGLNCIRMDGADRVPCSLTDLVSE